MKASLFRELVLYRYRYIVAYSLFVTLLVSLLLVDIQNIPYGIGESEMRSAVASNSLNPYSPHLSDIINLPYHLFQKLSISVLGLSKLSIVLPSIILALASGVLMAFMLHIWFRRNIAILALLISTVSVPFISMGRSGTPAIMFVFLLLVILYSAIRLTTKASRVFVWKLVVWVASLLLLYIPFGVYTLVALGSAAVFHPHIRYQIRRTSWWQFVVLGLVGMFLVMPHSIVAFHEGGVAVLRQLGGVATIRASFSPDHIAHNALSLVKTLFFFTKPNVSETITPFFNMTFMLLVAFGLTKTIINHSMARSYLVLIWLLFCIPMLLVDGSQLPLIFVPCVLLLAIGIETFIYEWYRLFPRNPYARISAMLPMGLIVTGLLAIAITRYFYAYTYTDTRMVFHPELTTVRQLLTHKPTQLVVPPPQMAFYDILRSNYPQLHVVTPAEPIRKDVRRIVLASTEPLASQVPSVIAVSHLESDAALVRVYEP